MSRIPYAAKQLIKEVLAIDSLAVSAPVRQADGLDVFRTIAFDAHTAQWLEPCLRACADSRIVRMDNTEGLTVTFRADMVADDIRPFHIDAAHRILTEED